jgi:MoaA/NifB/PqqE/SkfB family radical SAM enzyme
LISPDLFNILRSAQGYGYRYVDIQTNARMFSYEAFLERVLNIGPIRYAFLVSLHFPDKNLHNTYSRTDSFEQVIAGIKNLAKKSLPFTVNTVVMKQNLQLLGEITELVRSTGAPKQQFRMMDGHLLDNYRDFVPRLTDVAPGIREVIKKHRSHMEFALHEIPFCILGKDLIRYATPPINPERENLVMGNVIETSMEIAERQFMFSARCADCRYRALCRGIRNDYVHHYGVAEFKPFTREKDN